MSAQCSICFVLALFVASASAPGRRSPAGTIVGLVEDPSGAVVPNAQLAVKQTATGEIRTTATNAQWRVQRSVPAAGGYTSRRRAGGFKIENSDRHHPAGRSDRQPAHYAGSRLFDGDRRSHGRRAAGRFGDVFAWPGDREQAILDLPLNGRNPFALGLLSGNTTPMFGMGSNLPFIAGGGRFSANEVTLDGVDNNTVSNAGAIGRNGIAVVPSVDAVQEFKVKTSTFSAEFGHAAGAVVNATIKSGTNQFHGTLFEFLRNNDLDANNFFTNAAGQPRAPFHQNQFGGAVGGPVDSSLQRPNRRSSSPIIRARGRATSGGQFDHATFRRPLCAAAISRASGRRSTIPRRARSGRTES